VKVAGPGLETDVDGDEEDMITALVELDRASQETERGRGRGGRGVRVDGLVGWLVGPRG
jgi:hypothetical protein